MAHLESVRRQRPHRTILLISVAAVACSDSTGPSGGPGAAQEPRYYRFVSAGTGSTNFSNGFGDLLLRPNGTYLVVVTDLGGGSTGGRWDTTGTSLRLQPDSVGYDAVRATISGDSVRTVSAIGRGYPTRSMLFVRTVTPSAATVDAATYVLRTVNGAASTVANPALIASTLVGGVGTIRHLVYDTPTFSDRLFARESRLIVDSTYAGLGGSIVGYQGATSTAHYSALPGAISMRAYGGYAVAPVDTLAVAGDTLVRR